MKFRVFRIFAVALCALVSFSSAQAQSVVERYGEVIRQTARHLGLDDTLQTEGSEGDDIIIMTAGGAGSQPNQAVSLRCMVFGSGEVKKNFMAMANAFGQVSKEVYGAPPVSDETVVLLGARIKETDVPPFTTSGGPIISTSPRTRTMTLEPDPRVVFTVMTLGGPDPEPVMLALIDRLMAAGLFGPKEDGVSFTVEASADGLIPTNRVVDTGDVSPSSISVSGRVVDSDGLAVVGAQVRIQSLDQSTVTDAEGGFSLSVATEGSKPFTTTLTLTLQRPATGIAIEFEHRSPLPLPGKAELVIRAVDSGGKEVPKARVEMTWSGPAVLIRPPSAGTLDGNGQLRIPLTLEVPQDLGTLPLSPAALQLRVEVVVTPSGGGKGAESGRNLPLNAALIVGRTVGPDMKPRPETGPPNIHKVTESLVLRRWHDDEGEFRVLVSPVHHRTGKSPKEWRLGWSLADRLPLVWPMPEVPKVGAVIDVGLIDVLTPEEHNQRLRAAVSEFGAAMPLTSDQQTRFQAALQRLVFTDGSTADVPFYQDNRTDDSGSVHIPGKAEDYYGGNFRVSEDPAYPIMLHELGHFMHHHLVERYSYINFCYRRVAGGSHATWAMEPGMTALRSEYVSFSENTSDFFASLAWTFWLDRRPEMRESIYVKRPNYLSEFDTDEKAIAALEGGSPGSMVEGIQTRFLRAFYGGAASRRPAAVFDDYLNTMLLYMDRPTGVFEGLVNRPARKIHQWVETKRRLPGAFGPADPLALATRYRLLPGADPMPTVSPPWGEKPPANVRLNGRLVDFERFPVVAVPDGSRLKLGRGRLSLDLSTVDQRRTVILESHTEVVFTSRLEMVILKGAVSADFPITLLTPGGAVIPQGTVVRVEVDDSGNARVQTLHGEVRVEGGGEAEQRLEAGREIVLGAAGEMGEQVACDVEAIRTFLMPKGELPPLPEPRMGLSLKGFDLKQRIGDMPWWGLVMGALFLAAVVVTLLWVMRRVLAALVAAPVLASGLVAVGYLILRSRVTGGIGFLDLLLSPWSAWQAAQVWLPAVAWFIGGLAAGFIVGGPVRGLLTGALTPLAPWFLLRRPAVPESPADFGAAVATLNSNMNPDFLVLIIVAGLGAGLGGLLLPHRKRRKRAVVRSHPTARRGRDGDWDWDDGDE